MIYNYKEQDKAKNREFNNNEFVDKKWLLNQLNKQKSMCGFCYKNMELNSEGDDKVTIDRKNNELAHLKINCILSCWLCNVSRKSAIYLFLINYYTTYITIFLLNLILSS